MTVKLISALAVLLFMAFMSWVTVLLSLHGLKVKHERKVEALERLKHNIEMGREPLDGGADKEEALNKIESSLVLHREMAKHYSNEFWTIAKFGYDR